MAGFGAECPAALCPFEDNKEITIISRMIDENDY